MTIKVDDALTRLLSVDSREVEVLVARLAEGSPAGPRTGIRLGRDAELCPPLCPAEPPELYLG